MQIVFAMPKEGLCLDNFHKNGKAVYGRGN